MLRISKELAKKPQLLVANKVDVTEARDKLPAFVKAMKRRKKPVLAISSATGEGLKELLDGVAKLLFAKPGKPKVKSRRSEGRA